MTTHAQAGAWLPIETAPKGGADIILSNGTVVAEGHWLHVEGGITEHRDAAGRYIGQDEHDGHDGWIDWSGGMLPEPTCWQPLPAAPCAAPVAPAPADLLYVHEVLHKVRALVSENDCAHAEIGAAMAYLRGAIPPAEEDGGNGMVAALRAARTLLDELAPESGYGFFRPANPHDFTPDSENTEEEHAAHKAACEAYDRGEYVEESPSGWLSPNVHVTRAPWGPGSYEYRDPAIDTMIAQIDAALPAPGAAAAAPAEQTVNRATVIEWLDALDIEVTDRQLAGLFDAARAAQATGGA